MDILQAVVDAVLAINRPNEPIDLFMVEIMEMKHKTDSDTQWVYISLIHTHLTVTDTEYIQIVSNIVTFVSPP